VYFCVGAAGSYANAAVGLANRTENATVTDAAVTDAAKNATDYFYSCKVFLLSIFFEENKPVKKFV
jgi:hypothetical protein